MMRLTIHIATSRGGDRFALKAVLPSELLSALSTTGGHLLGEPLTEKWGVPSRELSTRERIVEFDSELWAIVAFWGVVHRFWAAVLAAGIREKVGRVGVVVDSTRTARSFATLLYAWN
ncbi:MAG: hypothetical protein NZ578_08445 [Candidatus Binatia bacterium]|nr:hypothetical protein [Candidatus Binatia bacterium]